MLNLSSKPLTVALGTMLIFFQYSIWSSEGGLNQIWKLKQSIVLVEEQNKALSEKNSVLAADVADLKQGDESIEEHARSDLGMIKTDEIFYRIIDK